MVSGEWRVVSGQAAVAVGGGGQAESSEKLRCGEGVGGEKVDGLAEERGVEDAGDAAEAGELLGGRVEVELPAAGAGRSDGGKLLEVVGLAADDELGGVDIAGGGAALGFVHVVGGDEER